MHITVAHRADSSGTSYIFTDYLGAVSSTWRTQVGVGKSPNWPTGVGGKGNPGVAAIVQQTPGAVGYVELAYVLQNHMTEAMVSNRAGKYNLPTPSSVRAAASRFPHVSAKQFSIVNASGSASYPICGYSWALLYKHPSDASKGKATIALMRWLATSGQQYAKALDYVPLPQNVQSEATSELNAA